MRGLFEHYYPPDDDVWDKLWTSGTFVLDANVLLNLYRYSKPVSDDLLRILDEISGHLWIPHQVALEYQENREQVIAEQDAKFDQVDSIVDDVRKKATGELQRLAAGGRHYSIDPSALVARVEGAVDEFVADLGPLRESQEGHHLSIMESLDRLFEARVGPPPKCQEDLDGLYEQADERYDSGRPPGYSDRKKGAEQRTKTAYYCGGLRFEMQYGDFLLWHEIIEEAVKSNWEYVTFITDDRKEDWWRIVCGRRTGPRFELMDEIRSKAGVRLFHMYSSDRFMAYARERFGLDVSEESIAQVQEVAEVVRDAVPGVDHHLMANAVARWVAESYPDDLIVRDCGPFPDFIKVSADGTRVGYEVRRGGQADARRLGRDVFARIHAQRSESDLDNLGLVFVLDRLREPDLDADWVGGVIDGIAVGLPQPIIVILGYLTRGGVVDNHPVRYVFNPISTHVVW